MLLDFDESDMTGEFLVFPDWVTGDLPRVNPMEREFITGSASGSSRSIAATNKVYQGRYAGQNLEVVEDENS